MIIFWNVNLKTFIIRWSTVFCMLKRKIFVPISGLFDRGYKFSYFFVKVCQKTKESIFHNEQFEKLEYYEYKNDNNDFESRYSGYCIFDVEPIKIKGI